MGQKRRQPIKQMCVGVGLMRRMETPSSNFTPKIHEFTYKKTTNGT